MNDVLVSSDCHLVEPATLWSTRLPKKYRDHALRWEFRSNPDGIRVGRHAGSDIVDITFPDGTRFWNARYRHADGTQMGEEADPAAALFGDLAADGVSGALLFPNLALTGVFGRDHELALAHAKVYNDYAIECFGAHRKRIAVLAAIPLTDPDDAVAEIERAAGQGFAGITCPASPPRPYYTDVYERVWAAAQANGLPVTFHSFTGFDETPVASPVDDVKADDVPTEFLSRVDGGLSFDSFGDHAKRLVETVNGARVPQTAILGLLGSGALERFPDLHFVFTEFNAHWFASLMGAVEKAYTVGIGQAAEWDNGFWNGDQPVSLAPFGMNDSWPFPLRPGEYLRRQVHVTFMDDETAVACRHLTGVETLLWGSDYPHAEGAFPRSRELVDQLFAGVEASERAAMVGGTTASLFNLEPTPAA